tara:strand:+ start:9206 stop:9418 length:213 start_codon:yes stop_codon:yes gene_type:complete
VHYRKANGKTGPKVFKLKELTLAPGEQTTLVSKRSLSEKTTRKHHPGDHGIGLLINGQPCGSAGFDLLSP